MATEGELLGRASLGGLLREMLRRLASVDALMVMILGWSTVGGLMIARIMRRPSAGSFILALPATELAHWVAAWQAGCLMLVAWARPALLRESLLAKLALLINLRVFFALLVTLGEMLQARGVFREALRSGGVTGNGFDMQGKWKYLFFSLIPLLRMARLSSVTSSAGRPQEEEVSLPPHEVKLFRKFNVPYAAISELDPKLVRRYELEHPRIRHINAMLGRGSTMRWLSLDITSPFDPSLAQTKTRGAPVLFYVHGGGWTVGDKYFAVKPIIERCASHGMVAVSINYRLAPTRAWPDHILDVKRALIWTKKNIANFGGDPRKIVVAGESAGGHLSSLVACTMNEPHFQPPEYPNEDTSVMACVDLYGVHDFLDENGFSPVWFPQVMDGVDSGMVKLLESAVFQKSSKGKGREEFELASPVYHVKQKTAASEPPKNLIPPIMLMHGTKDSLTSYKDSEHFFECLKAYRKKWGTWKEGESDIFITLPGAPHAFGYFVSPRALACADAIAEFAFHHAAKL